MYSCKLCGDETEKWYEVCDNCLKQNVTIENAIAMAHDEQDIGGLYAWLFGEGELESEIIRKYEENVLAEHEYGMDVTKRNLKQYLTDDESAFADALVRWTRHGRK